MRCPGSALQGPEGVSQGWGGADISQGSAYPDYPLGLSSQPLSLPGIPTFLPWGLLDVKMGSPWQGWLELLLLSSLVYLVYTLLAVWSPLPCNPRGPTRAVC